MSPAFAQALDAFIAASQAKIDAYYAEQYEHVKAPTLSYEAGPKNVRIVKNDTVSRSVYCFVRIEDGAILKADGWKKPAKGVRGSIYRNNGQDAVTHHGANYHYR